MYCVFEQERPANRDEFGNLTLDCWITGEFKTLGEANEYVRAWLSEYHEAMEDDLKIDEPYYFNGENYMVIHYKNPYADKPAILASVLSELDARRDRALKAEEIAKILQDISAFINSADDDLTAYPTFDEGFDCKFKGTLQINGVENLKVEVPRIIGLFAVHGYKVRKYEDLPQSAKRTYSMVKRDDDKATDFKIIFQLVAGGQACRYVQIGTKIREEAVYELRCDDPIVESEPDDFTGEAVESDLPSGEQREPKSGEQAGSVSGDIADSANLSEGLQPDSRVPEVDTEGQVECPEE